MHDGTAAHFSQTVRDVISNAYRDKWIGRAGPAAWPSCSPDLSLLDFYLWEHSKHLVYSAPIENEETLRQHIFYASQTIRKRPGTFESVRQSMTRGVHACIYPRGGCFEHLL
jgi:hypothetical protein